MKKNKKNYNVKSPLHDYIESKGLKLKKVAEDIGVSMQTLRMIKRGHGVRKETAKAIYEYMKRETGEGLIMKLKYRGPNKKPLKYPREKIENKEPSL